MRFIYIETKFEEIIAINTKMITKIEHKLDAVYIFLSGDKAIATKFTDIDHAVDYIQRASSISLSEVA